MADMVGMVDLVGCVLWHINTCGLSTTKSCLYISYIWFISEYLVGKIIFDRA